MEEIVNCVSELIAINKQLAEQNNKIVEKLEAIEVEMRRSREERLGRKKFRAERFRQMDIAYVMKHKEVSATVAAEKLEKHGYDVEKTIRSWLGKSEHQLEYIMAFYERKKNQAIIEMW